MLTIESYVSVDSLRFEESRKADALTLFGEPHSEKKNSLGALELHFPQHILRFDGTSSKLVECTLLPYVESRVDNTPVTWNKEFLRKLAAIDRNPREAFGFLIFPLLGIATTGIHDNDTSQLAVSAFARCYLDAYLDESEAFDLAIIQT